MKYKPQSKNVNIHAVTLIETVTLFLENLKIDDSGTKHPKASKEIASKVIKEWSSSLLANKSSNKEMIENKNKYAKLMKSIAEFLE